jgi:hypothetical protein
VFIIFLLENRNDPETHSGPQSGLLIQYTYVTQSRNNFDATNLIEELRTANIFEISRRAYLSQKGCFRGWGGGGGMGEVIYSHSHVFCNNGPFLFSGTPQQTCSTVPRQQCVSVPTRVPEEKCFTIPRQQCGTVQKQVPQVQCQQVPREQCTTVPRQQCQSVPRQQCR